MYVDFISHGMRVPVLDDAAKPFHPNPGDRRTGITKDEAALAATRNVLDGGLSLQRLAAIVVNYIEAMHGLKLNRFHRRKLASQTRIHKRYFEADQFHPSGAVGLDLLHIPYIGDLLMPPSKADLSKKERSRVLLEALCDDLPGDLAYYPEHLDVLRTECKRLSSDAHKFLIRGKLREALLIVRSGRFPVAHNQAIIHAVRHHVLCFIVSTAHAKVRILREHSRRPNGDRFAGFKKWCLVGYTCMATIAAPAALIQRLAQANRAGVFDGLSGEDAWAKLVAQKFLPAGDLGKKMMSLARVVERTLASRYPGKSFDWSAILDSNAHGCSAAASLNKGDMKREGLSQIDFSEHRLGLSASQGASFVALELHQAVRHANECIDAILEGRLIPPRRDHHIDQARVSFTSTLLRAKTEPDRNANRIGILKNRDCNPFDEANKGGRMPTKPMLQKIRNPEIERSARAALGIDVTEWF